MSFEDAAEALAAAVREDAGEQAEPVSAPQGSSPAVTPPVAPPAAPEASAPAPVAVTPEADTESFTKLDPNALPPELQPFYKSMQADYVRKTQEVAQQRKQFEEFGDPNTVTEALGLYNALQDPSSWQQLHAELSAGLQEMGLSPAQASAAATQELQAQAAAPELPSLDALNDPELEPLKAYVESLRGDVDAFKAELAQQRQLEEAQRIKMAVVGEMQRQENMVRANNPTYSDEDIDSIYELSSFFDGNLLQAQQRYEQVFATRLGRYLQQKQSVEHTLAPTSAAPTAPAPKVEVITNMDAAHRAAMEHLRRVEAEEAY